MEYIKGETFYNRLKKGIAISDDMIQQVEEALSTPGSWLNLSDIHLVNLILTETGGVGDWCCEIWADKKHARSGTTKLYIMHSYKTDIAQKIPVFAEIIAFLYKKDWFQKHFTAEKENILNKKAAAQAAAFIMYFYFLTAEISFICSRRQLNLR